MAKGNEAIANLNTELERDGFLRTILRHLSGVLENTIGIEEARGFISVVGRQVGDEIDKSYKALLKTDKLDREQVAAVLVDLKEKIQGDFFIIEMDEKKIVFGNKKCPFGDKVLDRPSLCMMTSNVFGTIASKNLGYAKVRLDETIAQGNSECRVTVFLDFNDTEIENTPGQEYFGD